MMRVLYIGWRLLWRSGVLTACSLVALIIMAMAQLGVYALAWTMIGPTDSYITNKWLSMAFPAAVGLVVGVSVAWRNWRVRRSQTLNGRENFVRSIAASLAAYSEVSMGVAAIRLLLESGVQSAKESISDGLTLEAVQPYIQVGLAEAVLLAAGVYAVVEITRRACLMSQPSVRTARDEFLGELVSFAGNLKKFYAGSSDTGDFRLRSYERAQRRMNEVLVCDKQSLAPLPDPRSHRRGGS